MKKLPFVILPGWLLGSKRFDPLVSLLQKQGHKVYVVDFPGFEQSPPLTQKYTLSDFVRFTEKTLKHQGIDKAVFICHSFGGRVALKLLSQHPHRAYALILSGVPGFRSINLRNITARILGAAGKVLIFIPPFFLFKNKLRLWLYRLGGSTDYFKISGFTKETFKSIVKEPLIEYMKKIRLPTLLIWGKDDPIVSVRVAKRMLKMIQNSELVIIPNSRHNLIYKNPEKFVQAVFEFLNKI